VAVKTASSGANRSLIYSSTAAKSFSSIAIDFS
jgi:hypothetical protein